jgi:hypothetical protein
MSMTTNPLHSYAQARAAGSYAEDRASIEDLQARYLFALDFHDPDLYVSTFTEDGVLDYGSGDVKGRQAIKDVIARMPSPSPVAGKRAGAARHNISNIVIQVDGNKAASRRIGSIIPTTIRIAAMSSMDSAITKTNWSRSTASGFSQSGRSTTKAVTNGHTRAVRIRRGRSARSGHPHSEQLEAADGPRGHSRQFWDAELNRTPIQTFHDMSGCRDGRDHERFARRLGHLRVHEPETNVGYGNASAA